MTRWIESQVDRRSRFDAEMSERAYAELAASVMDPNRAPTFSADELEQTDGAARACLKYCRVEAGDVPDSITDVEERIDWLCRPSGTMRREVRLDGKWYRSAFGAMLGKLDSGEIIALLPRGVSGYYFIEPSTKRKVKVTAVVAEHIEEEATLFYRPLPARPLAVLDLMKFILRVFDRVDYLLVFLAALAVAIIGLAPAAANQIAFATVVPSGQARLIAPIAALLLGAAVASVLINASRNLVMARVSIKLDVTVEAATFSRLLALPPEFFKSYSSGDLASRVANVTRLAQMLAIVFLGSGLSALLSTIYVLQIATFTPMLAMPSLVIALVQAALIIGVTVITTHYEKMTQQESARLSGEVTALLNGVQKIKLAGAESRAFAKWAHFYAKYAQVTYNRPVIVRCLPALVTIAGLIGAIVIYFLAGSAHVSVADYMAFNVAYGQVTAAIMQLATMAGEIAQIRPILEMVEPILEATPEVSAEKPSVDHLNGAIEMSGVSFRYSETSPYVLSDVSFKVRPGEYVAIVGKSGCGKSTIMRLLLGFERPERGGIYYGQYDVGKVDLRSLRQHIGTVMQESRLFMGDIFSNITISTPQATIDDAWAAAEVAGVAEDIRKMPMGMQTLVTEGSGGVSGGQRQRLMIARAVCGERRVLMFDEATSALDNITQKHVSDSLEELNCTRIVVAHRLSTVKHCDRILVVDGGVIAEEGTYDELIAKGGIFAELVAKQRLDTEE